MEQLNKVELRGLVGHVTAKQLGPFNRVRFSVMTEYCHRDKSGAVVIETTWHSVVAFAGSPDTKGLDGLAAGDRVFVSGRLRNSRYIDNDEAEHIRTEVFASVVKKEN